MNLAEIAGHLGADAEERYTATGKKVISLRIGCRTRQNGKDETIWWRVNLWGDRFDKMLPYLKKGVGLIVVGEISKPEPYMDKEGKPQVSLTLQAEIVKFSPFGKPQGREEQGGMAKSSASFSPPSQEAVAVFSNGDEGFTNDDLPF